MEEQFNDIYKQYTEDVIMTFDIDIKKVDPEDYLTVEEWVEARSKL